MFETLSEVIVALHNGILNGSDSAIGAMCNVVWTQVFGWVAGIVIGMELLNMLLDDDLVAGVRKLLVLVVSLLILAWFIKPSEGGCKVVTLKKDLLEFRAAATSAVAPEFAGGPADMVRVASTETGRIMKDYLEALAASVVTPPKSEVVQGAGAPPAGGGAAVPPGP